MEEVKKIAIEKLLSEVVESIKSRQFQLARKELRKVIDLSEHLADTDVKRLLLHKTYNFCHLSGNFDYGLEAVQVVLKLDGLLKVKTRDLTGDWIAYGNFQFKLNNLLKAIEAFKLAITISLNNEEYANAASGSTNLAMILINNNQVDEGIVLLENSLDYLNKAPFPRTEFITRFTYLQVALMKDLETEKVLEIAEGINKLQKFLTSDAKKVISKPTLDYVDRYVRKNKEIDKDGYIQTRFPWIL